jgi:HAMP domain-containing protein
MALSLRWRLTGWYVILLAVVLLLFSLGVYLAVERLLIENLDAALRQQANLMAQAIDEDEGQPTLARDVALPDIGVGDHFTRIYRTDQRLSLDISTVGEPIPQVPGAVDAALKGQQHLSQVRLQRTTLRIATFPIFHEGRIAGALQVGVTLSDIEAAMRALLQVLLVLAPATLLAASGGGWFLANRALAPIDHITRTAQRISAEQLSGRIGFQGPNDEIGRLGSSHPMRPTSCAPR